jgi:uncharacterized tellurite resistance protein B-like protein
MAFWRSLLGIEGGPDPGAPETRVVRKIVSELDHLPPDQATFVAVFAALLSRVARADLSISEAETRAMERIVVEHGALPEEQAIIVVQMAKTQNLLFGGTDNFSITQEWNRIADRERKLALLDCLFAVSAADRTISNMEDKVIRQIADEMLLEHGDYIDVRTRYRDQLSVLREPRPGDDPAAR